MAKLPLSIDQDAYQILFRTESVINIYLKWSVSQSLLISYLHVHCLFFFSETANITAFITNPSTPSYAVQGQSFTLEWTYTLNGTVAIAQFSIITRSGSELLIGRKFELGVITLQSEYQAQFRAQATNTRAELNILAVQRSDETT